MTQTPNMIPSADIPRIETAEAAKSLCARLLGTTAELVGLLDRETALLKQGKPREINSLYMRKSALNAVLTRDMSVFRRDAAFIMMAAPEEINAIRDQHAQLKKSIDANQDALVAMKAVSESLLHTIAAKAGARTSGPEVYGQDADVSTGASARPAAISVNTVL
ncbi:hypothetical protein BMS3Bbin10_02785 [bacterium BMS3Bbin10]|nr:hypothetical protein BMS3Bbin10_02785 [bacterium BMS3Bbin10]